MSRRGSERRQWEDVAKTLLCLLVSLVLRGLHTPRGAQAWGR